MLTHAEKVKCRFCSYSLPAEWDPEKSHFETPYDALAVHVTDEHWDQLTKQEKASLLPGVGENYGRSDCPKCGSLLDGVGDCLVCRVNRWR